ncbi:hypothetical protein FRB96_009021 [Tulasnella sp. 330]|nr:hypothetical protein FRB96_009021 [Tulasnella sp. 330]KAG8867841.1 hypothetical protein FRB98_003935 [Tulasnella sp. 332]
MDLPEPFPSHDDAAASKPSELGATGIKKASNEAKGVESRHDLKTEKLVDHEQTLKVPGTLETPPPFSVHNSEIRIRGDTHVISHDPHLNEDGEALYRFLLEQAEFAPTFNVSCKGTHEETRTRQVLRRYGDTECWETETYQVTIVDFDFTLDLTPMIVSEPLGPPIYVVGDRNATYRGKTYKEVDEAPTKTPEGKDLEMDQIALGKQFRREATSDEEDASHARKQHLTDVGLPPWVHLPGEPLGTQAGVTSDEARRRYQYGVHGADQTFDDSGLQIPSQDLRRWADEYCASKKMLKEFNFHKIVHGWNLSALQQEISRTLKANWAHSSHTPTITFSVASDVVSVRPDNWLSRILSHRFYKFLLCLFLIYPLIVWPYKKYGRGGGGEWRVAGAAYAMAKWVHLEDSIPGETVEAYSQRAPMVPSLRFLRTTPKGISRLEGTREGEWFSEWKETIAMFVRDRRINSTPVETPVAPLGSTLDGFHL